MAGLSRDAAGGKTGMLFYFDIALLDNPADYPLAGQEIGA